jgi:hypothetical protein
VARDAGAVGDVPPRDWVWFTVIDCHNRPVTPKRDGKTD